MRRIAEVVSFDPNIVDEAQTAVTGSVTLRGTFGKLVKPTEWDEEISYLDPYRQRLRGRTYRPLLWLSMFWNPTHGPR